ncbi:capsule assembly Wzi family protein [Amylibacter sp.]|nr:capsule assembly Wzi family protein [Amylibacter sp.]MDB4095664.1 capsule assembly Wzi family protein [Amylibacter sp.]
MQIKTDLTFFSERFLGAKNGHRYSNKGLIKFNLKHDTKNSSSQIILNYSGDEKYILDGSYLQYTSGIITFGAGLIDRNWSFSNNTSLILSQNARPPKSIYLKLENKFQYDWLPSEANWSFEVFNGYTEGSLDNTKSLITGVRAILTPVEGLNFELVQTSQWGGKGHNTGISALVSALFLDTNFGSNSNINKMAGFGISYKIPNKIMPLRIYGQAIGEDEAGALPSCIAYLAGLEWTNTKAKYPTIVGIEAVDTRLDTTTNNNCGPNTMYNNGIYGYTNYGKTMGTAIDTEGTSLGLHIQSQITNKLNIKFSTSSLVINDSNWLDHRLSSKRQSGLMNSLSFSWAKNNITFSGDIHNQGFSLDTEKIKSGYGINFSTSIKF